MSGRLDMPAAPAAAPGAHPREQTVGAGPEVPNSTTPVTWRDIGGTVRRHADELLEVYPELRRFGIPRSWLKRELWRAVPRAGFWPATLDITRTHWRRMLPGMFRPPKPGS